MFSKAGLLQSNHGILEILHLKQWQLCIVPAVIHNFIGFIIHSSIWEMTSDLSVQLAVLISSQNLWKFWKPWSVDKVSFVLKSRSFLESQSVIYADQRKVNDPAPCINSQQSAGCVVCQVLTPTLQLCRCPWAPVNLHRMTFCCNANKRSQCFQSISLWKALEVSTGIL